MTIDPRLPVSPLPRIPARTRGPLHLRRPFGPAREGETIAGALHAAGYRMLGRSSKYHRPRGLFCVSGHCGQCMMRVDGQPNIRTCVTPVRDGMVVESQNAWPSLTLDLAAPADWFGFLLHPGFQHRWFKTHRTLQHWWERFLRSRAGLGRLPAAVPPARVARREASPEILVVGGGVAGMAAAQAAAAFDARVWIIEKDTSLGGRLRWEPSRFAWPGMTEPLAGWDFIARSIARLNNLDNCRVLTQVSALGWYDEGCLLAAGPGALWVLTPRVMIVAAGSYGRPMLFPNNDLPGIILDRGVQRLLYRDGVLPGRRAVVAAENDDGYRLVGQLLEAGVDVAGVVDCRPTSSGPEERAAVPVYQGFTVAAAHGRRRVTGVTVRSRYNGHHARLACDLLVLSGARSPANDLVFQRTNAGSYVLTADCHRVRRPRVTPEMQATEGLYVAGEAYGGQDPVTAFLQGTVAGLAAAREAGCTTRDPEESKQALEALARRQTLP